MYQAKIIDVKADKDHPEISVVTFQFFKDSVPFGDPDIERGFTQDQADEYAKEKCKKLKADDDKKLSDQAQLDGMASFIASPRLGDVDVSDPAPTDEELAEQALQEKKMKLIEAKQYLDVGLIAQAEFDTVQAEALTAKSALEASAVAKPV
jgi:hypothetical protein